MGVTAMRARASLISLCVLGLAAAGCQRQAAAPAAEPEAKPAATAALAAVPGALASAAAAQLLCAQPRESAPSEPCLRLLTEQTTLATSTAALTAKFAAAEAAYQKDRAKLEEASATMALGIR